MEYKSTVSGNLVKIIKEYENHIIGIAIDTEGVEWAVNWNKKTHMPIDITHPNLKLESDNDNNWKEEIPWNNIRTFLKYVARDRNMMWHAYQSRPKLDIDNNRWIPVDGIKIALDAILMPKGPDFFGNAIASRPKEGEKEMKYHVENFWFRPTCECPNCGCICDIDGCKLNSQEKQIEVNCEKCKCELIIQNPFI